MKKILILLLYFVCPCYKFCYTAGQYQFITLTYDWIRDLLHVEAVHPSFNLEKSYVRLMNVYVNDNEVFTKDYFKQNDYNEFTDDVQVDAQVGDVIRLNYYSVL